MSKYRYKYWLASINHNFNVIRQPGIEDYKRKNVEKEFDKRIKEFENHYLIRIKNVNDIFFKRNKSTRFYKIATLYNENYEEEGILILGGIRYLNE